MMKTLLIVSALFIANLSWAGGTGTSIGNGGVGIMEGNKLYMLDLFEYSIHDQPAFGKKPLVHWLPERMKNTFPRFEVSDRVRNLLMQKISDVMRIDYFMGSALVGAIENLDWRMVNSSLIRLNDDDTVLNPKNLVQVAVRKGAIVFIDREKWELLDEPNKVALIVHESMYSLSKSQDTAVYARAVTGEVFTAQFLRSGYSPAVFQLGQGALPLRWRQWTYSNILFRKGSTNVYPVSGNLYFGSPYTQKEFFIVKEGDKIVFKTKNWGGNVSPAAFVQEYCQSVKGLNLVIQVVIDMFQFSPTENGIYGQVNKGYRDPGADRAYKLSRDQKACEIDFKRAIRDYEEYVNREFVTYQ